MNCYLVSLLFHSYPREVNVVYSNNRARKHVVRTPLELEKLVRRYNGLADIYTWLYNNNTIDKVVFDIDSPRDLSKAFNEASILSEYLDRKDILYIPVFTGGKGFHIYVMTEPWSPPNKETAKLVLRLFQSSIVSELGLKHVDRKLIGNVDHWIRIPNTLRRNGLWCTFLPKDFYKYSLREVLEYAREPQCFPPETYNRKLIDLTSYVRDNIVENYDYGERFHIEEDLRIESFPEDRKRLYRFLQGLIRPCVLKHVFQPDADHWIRTYFVTELMWLGFTEDQVERMIKIIGWEDYNPRITHYHVHKIYEKKLFPPTCKKLQSMGFCLGKTCPYYPSIFYWWGHVD